MTQTIADIVEHFVYEEINNNPSIQTLYCMLDYIDREHSDLAEQTI
jgi:hypothetical protein